MQNGLIDKYRGRGLTYSSCTVVHDFNGHGINGMHGVNGKKCYDGPFYVVNNGKIHVWL